MSLLSLLLCCQLRGSQRRRPGPIWGQQEWAWAEAKPGPRGLSASGTTYRFQGHAGMEVMKSHLGQLWQQVCV